MTSNDIGTLYDHFLSSSGISTDTRKISDGQLFFALKGENFNGNRYAANAIESGAVLAVIDEEEFESDKTFKVDDVLTTLQELSRYHRNQLNIPVIGLTGSNGKTTTKEIMQSLLSAKMNVFATPGNLNNHIGVPLSLLQINQDHELAIIELGANHIGEIAFLCELCSPTHGLITNVGKDHLEGFGSFEGSLRANSELYQYLIETNGSAFINSNDPILKNMGKRFKNEVICYPREGDYYHCQLESANPFLVIEGEEIVFETKMIGSYNFINIAASLCVAKYFGVEEPELKDKLESYLPRNNRSEFIQKNGVSIVLDAYNANPSSVEVAIDSLNGMDAKNKVIILGDMYELGEYSKEEHKNIGELAVRSADEVILCGKEFENAIEASRYSNLEIFTDRNKLFNYLKSKDWKENLILVKGSRGMKMEEVVDYLT